MSALLGRLVLRGLPYRHCATLQWPSKEALKRQPKLGVDFRLLVDGTHEEILADLRKMV
jgi:hypothetical protein